jgi:hypothetical protein
MRKSDDLTPLPAWKQKRAALAARWRGARDSRVRAYAILRKAGRKGLTLAISVVGAILVSFGAWQVYAPAGFVAGGILLWVIQWNYGGEGSDG